MGIIADIFSTRYHSVVPFLPSTFVHAAAREEVQQDCRTQEGRLDWRTPSHCRPCPLFGRHLMGRPSSAMVVSEDLGPVDLWCCRCHLLHSLRSFPYTQATYRSNALLPRLARIYLLGNYLCNIWCCQYRSFRYVATASHLHLRIHRQLLGRVCMAVHHGCFWPLGWHCRPRPVNVLDRPYQISDPRIVYLDDSFPGCHG